MINGVAGRTRPERKTDIMKGSTLTVVKGRKVAKGTTGVCIWYDPNGAWGARVGIKDAAGTVHWTAASNCRVDDAAPVVEFIPVAGFVRGVKVETVEGPGKVFWVGPDKRNAGGTRVGVKLTANGATVWASTTECQLEGAVVAEDAAERAAIMAEAAEHKAACERDEARFAYTGPSYTTEDEHTPDASPIAAPIGAALAWASGG